jgi:DNA-binding NtrC family response regulator
MAKEAIATMKKRILIIEDSLSLAAVYQAYLENDSYTVGHVELGKEAMIRLIQSPPDAILLDLKLPDMDGMDILKYIHQHQLPTIVIIITAHGSIDAAVNAMQYGAFDFLEKPFEAKKLQVTVANALSHQDLEYQVEDYKQTFDRNHYEGFIGESLVMQAVYRIIDSAAPSRATVFITGESGTGKEVCAHAIHKRSPRSSAPFIALNCGAIPKELMESEIFGHVKGAFTGASQAREGAAAMADGGTLFLDELCEMDLDLQTKLLRFIQTGMVQKVGSNQQQKVDVRFVCATNKDPSKEVEAGRFREDLFYRLHVIPIQLPPLRDRDTDIKMLVNHLIQQYAKEEGKAFQGFDSESMSMVMGYSWPGNVRQLQNVVRNIVVLNNAEHVTADMLPEEVKVKMHSSSRTIPTPLSSTEPNGQALHNPISHHSVPHQPVTRQPTEIRPLWMVEKEAIEQAIAYCDGNIPKAAALLDVSASTIYRKKEKWGNQ